MFQKPTFALERKSVGGGADKAYADLILNSAQKCDRWFVASGRFIGRGISSPSFMKMKTRPASKVHGMSADLF